MKRFLALTLALLMVLTSLLSCGSSTDPADEGTDAPADEPGSSTDEPGTSGDVSGETDEAKKQRETYEVITPEDVDNPEDGPFLIRTVYPTEQTVIANIIVTPEAYDVDPTGVKDSTAGIQKAIDDCRAMGGGTVFLPIGQYVVSDTVQIGEGVLLQGDWQDPDLTDSPEYGTVILAKIAPLSGKEVFDPSAKPLFRLIRENAGNNGLSGLTFFYPEQDIADVKAYGYTVYAVDPSMTVLRNLTMLNSYQGIGACLHGGGHELLHIEKVRMTALVHGYQAKKSSEIGYTYDFSISPKYWRDAAEQYRCADAEALRDFCRENTVAMKFHSLDLNQYTGIRIEGAYTAMLIDAGFWGIFYDVEIKDSVYGIVAKALTGASGVGVARATIEADEYAVVNYAAGGKPIKLTDVKVTGKGGIHTVEGAYTMIDNSEDTSKYDADYGTYKKPVDILYVADVADFEGEHEDAAPAIQEALDIAGLTGGIVYVPHGVYNLYSPLSVPTGVELRGAMAMPARDKNSTVGNIPGTVFLTYLEDGDFITLAEGSGVQGFRIFYVPYDASTAIEYIEAGDSRVDTCVGVRGTGKDVYAVNMVVTGCFVGIDFTDCDNHLVKNTFGLAYRHFVRAGGENGHIDAVLCNQTFTMRQPFYPRGMYDPDYYNDANWKLLANESQNSYAVIRDLAVRKYCDTFYIKDAKNETLNNAFMYGCHSILVTDNAEVLGINLTSDWQGICPMFVVKNNSSLTAFNPVRTSGTSHEGDESSSLALFNRLLNIYPNEPTYRSDSGYADTMGGEPINELMLLDCDSTTGTANVKLNTNSDYIVEGSGSLMHDGKKPETWLTATFKGADTAELGEGPLYLHLSVWVDNPHQMQWSGRITLGTEKGDYCSWGTVVALSGEGWNEIFLPIPEKATAPVFTSISITVDHSTLKEYPVVYMDDIYVCNVIPYVDSMMAEPSNPAPYPEREATFGAEPSRIMINDCESLEGLSAAVAKKAELNTDPAYVKEGKSSIKVTSNGSVFFEYNFPATDAREFKTHGYLHMWVYVDNADALSFSGQIELCSGGTCDIGEIGWDIRTMIKNDGWNELYLPLPDATATGVPVFNAAGVNYLRLFTNGTTPLTAYIDDIYICNLRNAEYNESNTIAAGNAEALFNAPLPTIHNCDTDLGITVATLNTDPKYIKEGEGSLKVSVTATECIVYAMPVAKDITEYMDGYLHMWVYINDISLLGDGQIELTSGGTCDKEEIAWSVMSYITKSGWNEVYLPLSKTFTTGGEFKPERCNFFRIYTKWRAGDETPAMYIDDLRVVSKEDGPVTGGSAASTATNVVFSEQIPEGMRAVTYEAKKGGAKEGEYWMETSTLREDRFVCLLPNMDVSSYDGYLHLWMYVEDYDNIKEGQIEITSAGTFDKEETCWDLLSYLKGNGWNELWLPIGGGTRNDADMSCLNYMRIYSLYKSAPTEAVKTGFDDIRFATSNTVNENGDLIIFDGETIPANFRNSPVQDGEKVKEGNYSIETTVKTNATDAMSVIYPFNAIDASSYKDGYLHLWIYVSNYESFIGGGIELTSSGKWDEEEISWQLLDYLKGNGWTELWLPLNGASRNDANLSRINYMRVYTLYKTVPQDPIKINFDDVRLTNTK